MIELNKEQKDILDNFKDDAMNEFWNYVNEHIDQVIDNPYNEQKEYQKYDEFRDECFEYISKN